MPALDVLDLDAAQVDRGALSGHGFIAPHAMHLDAADFDGTTLSASGCMSRHDHQLGVDAQAAGHQRPRHDGAEAFHREHAVDRQPRRAAGGTAAGLQGRISERSAKGVESQARSR